MSKVKTVVIRAIPYILAIAFLVLWLKSCENIDRLSQNVKTLNSTLSTVKLNNGQLASSNRVLLVTDKELKKQVYVQDDSIKSLLKLYKEPQIVYKIKTVTEIRDVEVDFDEPIDFKFSKRFKKFNDDYSISGFVDNYGFNIDTLDVPADFRIVTGIEKGWFKNTVSTSLTVSSDFVKIKSVETQKVSIRNKRLGVGPALGYGNNGFFVGVVVSYHLIQF